MCDANERRAGPGFWGLYHIMGWVWVAVLYRGLPAVLLVCRSEDDHYYHAVHVKSEYVHVFQAYAQGDTSDYCSQQSSQSHVPVNGISVGELHSQPLNCRKPYVQASK